MQTTVMFCSPQCATAAWTRYYKFEFKVTAQLYNCLPSTFPVRPTLKAFTMVNNPAELQELVDSIDVARENAFDIDFTQCTERDQFRAFYALTTNEKLQNDTNFHYYITCTAVIYHLLRESSPELKEMFEVPAVENLFLQLVLRCSMIGDANGFGIADGYRLTKNLESMAWQGDEVFLIHSLYSHSCCPNVENYPADNIWSRCYSFNQSG